MKRTLKWICWLLLPPLLWGGCSKEPNCPERRLPPITTEGRNTIGFKLDGEVWTPHVKANVIQTPLDFGKLTVVYYPNTDFFTSEQIDVRTENAIHPIRCSMLG